MMKPIGMACAIAGALMVAGCARTTDPAPDVLVGNAPQSNAVSFFGLRQTSTAPVQNVDIRVDQVRVTVPETLVVSEENTNYPPGDIVWRGDPPGDRHAQIKSIFDTAAARSTEGITGNQPVIVDIQVRRFHSLTEKTRYTVGGVHSIRFDMLLRDAQTGAPLGARHTIKADLKGYGGQRAIDADQQGLTQKVRITDHLSSVISAQLGAPAGPGAPTLSLVETNGG